MAKLPVLIVDFISKQEELMFLPAAEFSNTKITLALRPGRYATLRVPSSPAPGYFIRHWGTEDAELIPLNTVSLERILGHKFRKETLLRHLASRGTAYKKKKPLRYQPSRLRPLATDAAGQL